MNVGCLKTFNNYSLINLKKRFFLLIPKQQMDSNFNFYIHSFYLLSIQNCG